MNQAFSKIWIVVITVILLSGGIFISQYLGVDLDFYRIARMLMLAVAISVLIWWLTLPSEEKERRKKEGAQWRERHCILHRIYISCLMFIALLAIGLLLWAVIVSYSGAKEKMRILEQERSQERVEVPKETASEEIVDETTDWQTYRNEEYGFELKYPSFLETGQPGCRISEIEDTIFIGPISLTFFDIQGLTLDEWINKEIAETEEETKKTQENHRQAGYENWQGFGSKLLSREEISIGGERAVKLSYQFVGVGFDLPVTISIKNRDRIYDFRTNDANLVQEECAAKFFGKAPSETMELMLSTFRFLE